MLAYIPYMDPMGLIILKLYNVDISKLRNSMEFPLLCSVLGLEPSL